jgi:hypothetical protein
MRFYNLFHILGFHFGIQVWVRLRWERFQQAEPGGTFPRNPHVSGSHANPGFPYHFFHFFADFLAAAGHTTRTESDANFTFNFTSIGFAEFL